MPCTLAFPTIIFQDIFTNCSELNEKLKNHILQLKKESSGITKSNINAWHSDTNLFESEEPAINDIKVGCIECLEQVIEFQLQNKQFEIDISIEAWANVITDGGYNKLHNHPNSNWSGVYYVSSGEEEKGGMLDFLDPRNQNMFKSPGIIENEWLSVEPRDGKIIIFPSYLHHFVNPYYGKEERISIAFNVTINELSTSNGG